MRHISCRIHEELLCFGTLSHVWLDEQAVPVRLDVMPSQPPLDASQKVVHVAEDRRWTHAPLLMWILAFFLPLFTPVEDCRGSDTRSPKLLAQDISTKKESCDEKFKLRL